MLHSYRLCDSSPCVFDSVFKTFAHMKKFRDATDTFCRMKDYGFFPTIESCNAYMSSLLDLHRMNITLAFYREMRRHTILPNVYTLNMVMRAYSKLGKLEKALETFREMESMGFRPNTASYNTLIAGHCSKGLLSFAIKLKNSMERSGVQQDVVTSNMLIHGVCKEGKLHEANRVFIEMKAANVTPNIEGKTKNTAYLVKELDKHNLVPNASTFSALFVDFDGAVQVLKEMFERSMAPNSSTLSEIYNGLCQCVKIQEANILCSEMEARDLMPASFGKSKARDLIFKS
ncbi:hypothetical protein FH972_014237 [Carpinus fangiana]|uniref:Pentacotripeptide-repeat region of PRORP domain-containing protein n=1 Tax=Carpinus fangiana TaxID=176857 RepID=A0A5N6RCN6_9ROSI|nr:hypothetical protein FH972_014237 [Carpinus fangiana]